MSISEQYNSMDTSIQRHTKTEIEKRKNYRQNVNNSLLNCLRV